MARGLGREVFLDGTFGGRGGRAAARPHPRRSSPRLLSGALASQTPLTTPLSRRSSLIWGEAGSSNALNVATRLGFDREVVDAARLVMEVELGQGGHGGEQRAAELAKSLEEQQVIAQHEVSAPSPYSIFVTLRSAGLLMACGPSDRILGPAEG